MGVYLQGGGKSLNSSELQVRFWVSHQLLKLILTCPDVSSSPTTSEGFPSNIVSLQRFLSEQFKSHNMVCNNGVYGLNNRMVGQSTIKPHPAADCSGDQFNFRASVAFHYTGIELYFSFQWSQ